MTTICGAKTRAGSECQQPAGWGTDHTGEGRCKLHGGASTGPLRHGRYSVKHRESLAEKYQAFRDDPRPGELLDELAMMRALFQDYLSRFDDGLPLGAEDIERMFDMLDHVGRLVERISRIMNSTALTAAEVQYLQARLIDMIGRYVDADKRQQFLSELKWTIESGRQDQRRG